MTEDELQAEATRAAGDAVLEQLKRAVASDRDRRIRTLCRPEIENIAMGAIAAWVKMRAEQAAREPSRDGPGIGIA